MITVCDSFGDGVQLFDAVKQLGLEGIVSKSKDSRYHLDSRSPNWIKVKNYLYDVVQIGAIRKAEFGWSLLKDGRYVGVTEFVPPAERELSQKSRNSSFAARIRTGSTSIPTLIAK